VCPRDEEVPNIGSRELGEIVVGENAINAVANGVSALLKEANLLSFAHPTL